MDPLQYCLGAMKREGSLFAKPISEVAQVVSHKNQTTRRNLVHQAEPDAISG